MLRFTWSLVDMDGEQEDLMSGERARGRGMLLVFVQRLVRSVVAEGVMVLRVLVGFHRYC